MGCKSRPLTGVLEQNLIYECQRIQQYKTTEAILNHKASMITPQLVTHVAYLVIKRDLN